MNSTLARVRIPEIHQNDSVTIHADTNYEIIFDTIEKRGYVDLSDQQNLFLPIPENLGVKRSTESSFWHKIGSGINLSETEVKFISRGTFHLFVEPNSNGKYERVYRSVFVGNLTLRRPLTINVRKADNLYFVESKILNVSDFGESEEEALFNLSEYIKSNINLMKSLEKEEKHISLQSLEQIYRKYFSF
ncbi:hypothetical protein [Leptospira levettii]|uniref:Uncharacterized protein n=1 Tax=Leptospira levettii TaxID=2023178 RepID=A0ABY2MU08_9LEPT|nr:hypothetical protein [Leptospira levettii]TGL75422.1 hypothetical protein EHQ60_00425 [Leptospira levettii]